MPEGAELEKLIQDCMRKKGWTYDHCKRYIAGGIWSNASPDVSDVHIPGQVETQKKKKKTLDTFTIERVPIMKTGIWTDANGKKVNLQISDLEEIVKNTNSLLKARLLEPRIKLGHNEAQPFKVDGLPAIGHVVNLYRIGNDLFGDFIDVPRKIYDLIGARAYTNVSAELYENFEHPVTKEKIGKVLKAVALLGADMPAIKGMGDIMNLYSEMPTFVLSFSESELREVNEAMKNWTLKDIERILPCCVDKAKTYMQEKKKESLTTDELAEFIADLRLQKLQEDEAIECPEGYEWDAEKERCVPADEKVQAQEQKVCPKGWEWNEELNKCVKVEVEKEREGKKMIKVDADIKEKIGDEIDEGDMIAQAKKAKTKLSEKKFALPGGDPAGWTRESYKSAFDSLGGTYTACLENVSGVTTPERFCAWLKYKATGEWPGTEEWRTKEQEDKEKKELMEKVAKLEKEKREKIFAELREGNKGILLPAFDPYLDFFIEYFEKQEEVVKFGEQNYNISELFLKFLQELVKSKGVIMQELINSKEAKEEMEKISLSEEEINKFTERYKEERPGMRIDRADLALLAEKIAKEQKISDRDALIIASKMLEKK